MPHVELPSAEFKVVLLGDTNTGKTCLVLRLVEGSYKPLARSSTVGAFFLTKRLTVNNITCKMLLWDTAGQEQFQKLAVTYYQHAAAAIVCYDSSNPNSVVRLRKSLQELDKYIKQNHTPMVLAVAACKSDLSPVPGLEAEARRIAKAHDALYFGYTSAKTNQGVMEVFTKTAARVLEWHELAVAGQARPLPVTVGSQARGLSPSKRRSSGYRSPSERTSLAHENSNNNNLDAIMTPTSTSTTPAATTVASTPLAAQLSNANGSVPLVLIGSGGGGAGIVKSSFSGGRSPSMDAILSGDASSINQNYINNQKGQSSAAAADQDSSTTANESDDATLEHEQQQNNKYPKFQEDQPTMHDHDDDYNINEANESNTNNSVPTLKCDGTYLVCGVDGNDKSCVIS